MIKYNLTYSILNAIHALKVRKSGVSFKNSHEFLKCVDSLYSGPGWTCQTIDVEGDVVGEDGVMKRETLELWQRDPVECVEELIGNPML